MNNTPSNDSLHSHDLTDEMWAKIEPLLPGRRGVWGGVAQDNRRFVNAVFWIMRTGTPWRNLPPEFGGWSNTHRRFIRWRDAGIWERLLEVCLDEPGMEWLMVDAARANNRQSAVASPRFIWPLIHLVFRSESLSLRVQSLIARRLSPSSQT